jgi:hypothetical protein
VVLHVIEEIVGGEPPPALANVVEEVITTHDRSATPAGPNDPPAPGAAGVRAAGVPPQ